MDDNELDRLFGYDGGTEGSGADESEKKQNVEEKKEKAIEGFEVRKAEETKKSAAGDEEEKEEEKDSDPEEKSEDAPAKENEDGEDKPSSGSEEGSEEKEDAGADNEEKPSEPVKEEKPKKKKKRYRLTRAGVLFIVLMVLLITIVMLFLFLPAFRVREVTIDGNVELTDEQVLEEVGLQYNAHLMSGVSGNLIDILSFNYGKTEEKIRNENPYIADITISIRIPSEVRITVKERRKIAYVSTPDGFIALDRNGTVLELNSGKNTQTVSPVIYGISVESAKLGERVKVRDENSYKKAIIVLGAILAADNATIGDDFNMFEHTKEVRVIPSGYIS